MEVMILNLQFCHWFPAIHAEGNTIGYKHIKLKEQKAVNYSKRLYVLRNIGTCLPLELM